MLRYVLSVLFYLPVAATYYVHPVAGLAVSTGYMVYHFWTHRIQNEVQDRKPAIQPVDIDELEVVAAWWDPMNVIKDD